MFKHRIKVPQLYKHASKIASSHAAGEGSIKNLVYKMRHPNLKAIYALVIKSFQHWDEINFLLQKSQLLIKENINEWLARILITELFWGSKRLQSEAIPIKTILEYKYILTEYLNAPNEALFNDKSYEPILFIQVEKPRYVRINTLKVSTDYVITQFQNEGWRFQRKTPETYEEFLEKIINLQEDEFMFDYHIPNMLVFAKKTEFFNSDAYLNSEIILQDKASCLPVHLLDPKPGSCVLDMCAAPGLKTTHMAALMENKGKIYAVEINKQRFETMNELIVNIGANCIKTIWDDVIKITNQNCPNVEYILVDPSCSGSGITSRECINERVDQHRLNKLAGFQAMILRHALTDFPKAKRVVYSTCSLNSEENEAVVQDVIQTCKDFKLVDLKTLMQDKWINFGLAAFGGIGQRCLRTVPESDYTNGFFVAIFERLEPNETNEFFIKEYASRYGTKQNEELRGNSQDLVDLKTNTNGIETNLKSEGNAKKTTRKRKKSTGREDNDGKNEKTIKETSGDNKIIVNNDDGGCVKLTKKRKKNRNAKKNRETTVEKQEQDGESNKKVSSHWLCFEDEDFETVDKCKKEGVEKARKPETKSKKKRRRKKILKKKYVVLKKSITNTKPSTN